MIEALGMPFFQHALLAALLASAACGVMGSLVVVNRLVFLAGGVAHAAYGGVGLAFALGAAVLPTALGFAVAAAMAMAWVALHCRERSDTLVGVMWAGGMACGILLIDLTPGYHVDLMSYLFGSLLTVPAGDLWIMLGLDALILALVGGLYRPLLTMSFDPEFARSRGVPVTALTYLLMALVAGCVVLTVRVVGLILVIALLTIPPALAERATSTLAGMMALASVLAAGFCLAGLALAYMLDVTSGASIIAVAVAAYAAAMMAGALRGNPGMGRS